MVHTLPDYTTKYRMAKIFGQIDSGELAARLGSNSVLDRRGNIINIDSFDSTAIKYYTTSNGASAAHVISTNRAYSGDSSLKVTAGPANANWNIVAKMLSAPPSSKIGFETMVLLPNKDVWVYIGITGYTGTVSYLADIRYDVATNQLEYLDSTNTHQVLDTILHEAEVYYKWTNMKLVIDWTTKKYVRCIMGDTEYDLSTYDIYNVASATDPLLEVYFMVLCGEAADINVYYDYMIVTQNEP